MKISKSLVLRTGTSITSSYRTREALHRYSTYFRSPCRADTDQIVEANRLIKAGKEQEAITYILDANQFTKQAYAELNDPKTVSTVESMVDLNHRISKKAASVGADIPSEDKKNLQEAGAFFRARSKASDTMVHNVLQLAKQFPNAPVAMTAGTAHTEKLTTLLRQAGVPFAVSVLTHWQTTATTVISTAKLSAAKGFNYRWARRFARGAVGRSKEAATPSCPKSGQKATANYAC